MRTLFIILSLIIATPAWAAEPVPQQVVAEHKALVKINGLVCDFCARSLEKIFGQRQEVSGIKVDLTSKLVTIGFNKGKDIDDATITKLITDAGYSVVNIQRQ